MSLKTSKENQENTLLLLQALCGVGGDLKEHFKGSKEYRRVGIRSQERQHHVDVRVFQHSTVHKCFLLCIIHSRQCFSIVVNQLVYLLEDKALLISDKKTRLPLFYKVVLGKTSTAPWVILKDPLCIIWTGPKQRWNEPHWHLRSSPQDLWGLGSGPTFNILTRPPQLHYKHCYFFPQPPRICLDASEGDQLEEFFSHFLQYVDERAMDLLGSVRNRPKSQGKNHSLDMNKCNSCTAACNIWRIIPLNTRG